MGTYIATPGGAMDQTIASRACVGKNNVTLLKPSRVGPGSAIYCTPTGRAILFEGLDQWAMVPIKSGKSAIEICAPLHWTDKNRVMDCVNQYRGTALNKVASVEAEKAKRQSQLPYVPSSGLSTKAWLVIGGLGVAILLVAMKDKK